MHVWHRLGTHKVVNINSGSSTFSYLFPHPFPNLQLPSFCFISKIAGGRSYYGQGRWEEVKETHFSSYGSDCKFWSSSFQT